MPRKKVNWRSAYRGRFIRLGPEWLDLMDVIRVTPQHGPSGVQLNIQSRSEGGGVDVMQYRGPLIDDVHKVFRQEGF